MFHDCGTWSTDQGETGGCDGSLILAQEFNRPENNGLQDISGKLLDIAQKHAVGVADLIVFAASVAVATCPLGPIVRSNDFAHFPTQHRLTKIFFFFILRLPPLSAVQTPRTRLLMANFRIPTKAATIYLRCSKIKASRLPSWQRWSARMPPRNLSIKTPRGAMSGCPRTARRAFGTSTSTPRPRTRRLVCLYFRRTLNWRIIRPLVHSLLPLSAARDDGTRCSRRP